MKKNKKLSIEEIKNIESNVLFVFGQFCEQYKLKYYLTFGTLLGAVRHKGFIPWDDDIDVTMPRPDYNRLMELLEEKNNFFTKNIELKTPYCSNYQYPFCKVIDNTTFVHEKTMKKKYNTSVWIDVFPLDAIPENRTESLKFSSTINTLRKYYFYTIEKKFSGKSLIGKFKFNTVKTFCTPLFALLKMKTKLDKLAQKYDFYEAHNYSILLDPDGYKISLSKEDLQSVKVTFENHEYFTFKNYDKVLTDFYGNYMQLPPVEKRVCTHSLEAFKIEESL